MATHRGGPLSALDAFYREIGPISDAYKHAAVSFIGHTPYDGIALTSLLIQLAPLAVAPEKPFYKSQSIVAGRFLLSSSPREFVERLVRDGAADTPFGKIYFHAKSSGGTKLKAFDERGLASQGRLTTLKIEGVAGGLARLRRPELDWELRASETPYSDLSDLLVEYGLPIELSDSAEVQIEAFNVAVIDYGSPVFEDEATPTVRMAGDLDIAKLRLGVKIITPDAPPIRTSVRGTELEWKDDENIPGVRVGATRMQIPPSAILQCFVSYDGAALHYGWLRDNSVAPNSLRAVIEAFDPDLESTVLSSSGPPRKGRAKTAADDLEHNVASILWMLGFSVHRIGAGHSTTDAVDIIGRTPAGNYVLVECTTGLLKRQHKLANLLMRTTNIRRVLAKTWNKTARVVPVIVTSLSQDEVRGELEEAEQDGVRVYTAEDLDAVVKGQTVLPPDPDRLFSELESYLREKGVDLT